MEVTHARDHAQATHCHDKLFTHHRLINARRARPRSVAIATLGLKSQILTLPTTDTPDGVVVPSEANIFLASWHDTFMKHHTGNAINNGRQYPWCTRPQAPKWEPMRLARHCNASMGVHLVATWRLDPRPHKDSMLRATTRFGTSAGHFVQQSSGKIPTRVANTRKLTTDTLPTADMRGTARTPQASHRNLGHLLVPQHAR